MKKMKKPLPSPSHETCPYCGNQVLSAALHLFICPKMADLEGEEGEATREWVRQNEKAIREVLDKSDNE